MVRGSLPPGRYFTLAWTIPDRRGGLTSALLQRTEAFVKAGAGEVTILTFDDRVDYPVVAEHLRDQGVLIPGMRVRNLWDDLRETGVPPLGEPSAASERVFTPLPPGGPVVEAFRDGVCIRRRRLADDGRTVLQTDHYRLDGSLLASDRKDVRERGTLGGRSVVVCDSQGHPVRAWGRMRSLYRFWLDRVTGGSGTAYLIADGKPVINFLHTYRRPNRVTVHVVHGSHLTVPLAGFGPLRPSRAEGFRHLRDYDAVVFLTTQQRRDTERRFGSHPNFSVIPNTRRVHPPPSFEREAGRGAFVGRLSALKRPHHAAHAALLAHRFAPTVTLEVYGEGSERPRLDALSARRPEVITTHGWTPDTSRELQRASFLLLTSRSEGFGLVILEAMAAGCIPIAYDIRYGPRDLIDHGRTGFLVHKGNIIGLARAILQLQHMPADDIANMRQAARRASLRYTDEAVLPLWVTTLTQARNRRGDTL